MPKTHIGTPLVITQKNGGRAIGRDNVSGIFPVKKPRENSGETYSLPMWGTHFHTFQKC